MYVLCNNEVDDWYVHFKHLSFLGVKTFEILYSDHVEDCNKYYKLQSPYSTLSVTRTLSYFCMFLSFLTSPSPLDNVLILTKKSSNILPSQ